MLLIGKISLDGIEHGGDRKSSSNNYNLIISEIINNPDKSASNPANININTYTFFYFKADNGASRWMGNAVGM